MNYELAAVIQRHILSLVDWSCRKQTSRLTYSQLFQRTDDVWSWSLLRAGVAPSAKHPFLEAYLKKIDDSRPVSQILVQNKNAIEVINHSVYQANLQAVPVEMNLNLLNILYFPVENATFRALKLDVPLRSAHAALERYLSGAAF
jgi:hypothetical protein